MSSYSLKPVIHNYMYISQYIIYNQIFYMYYIYVIPFNHISYILNKSQKRKDLVDSIKQHN